MFGFIKNLFKPKIFKEEIKANAIKENGIAKTEDIEKKYKASELIEDIFNACSGTIRPGQTFCPPLVISPYKKLLVLGDEEALGKATDILGMCLSKVQQQDFMNQVRQLKEYKEYKIKQRKKHIEEDFK